MKPFLFFFAALFLAGCRPAQPSLAPDALPGDSLTATAPTEIPPGPWLLLPAVDGLWAYDTTQEYFSLVEQRHILAPQDVSAIASPGGGWLAYITGVNGIEQLTLNLLRLPGEERRVQPLIAAENYPSTDDRPGDPAADGVRAIFEITSLDWAADGKAIAFVGLLDERSADVYALHLDHEQPVRLSTGQGQAIQPRWAPDGRRVVYASVEAFGSDGGYIMDGVWLANADGSDTRLLYETGDSRGEFFVGWRDENNLLVHSWGAACGNENLRTVNILDGTVRQLWPGAFNGTAFDPITGNVLVSMDQYTSECSASAEKGLYFLPGMGGEARRILEDEAFLPLWSQDAGLFLARTPGDVFAVGPAGEAVRLPAPEPSLPSVSVNDVFAWASPASGVWVTVPGNEPERILDEPAFAPAWDANGRTLFFITENGLYRAPGPDFSPTLLKQAVFSGAAFWVESEK